MDIIAERTWFKGTLDGKGEKRERRNFSTLMGYWSFIIDAVRAKLA